MKIKIIAAILLFGIIFAVILNTVMLTRSIDQYTATVSALEIDEERTLAAEAEARAAYAQFKRCETYMSLTVNHNDLTAIEELFSEMIGQLSVGDADGAKVTKNRLIDALSHLRRLSGVNIDSVV